MRRTLILIALALIALIGGLGAWGMTLPREHSTAVRVTLTTPVDSVYALMRDIGGVPGWWNEVDTAVPVPSTDGRDRWKETMGGAEFVLYVSEEEPGSWFVSTIDTIGAPPFGGTWRHEVAAAPNGGTLVTITEAGWVDNPFFRAMMQFSGPEATLDSYLTALGAHFGQSVTPEPVLP